MIKNFYRNNVRINNGFDGHYPIPLDKSIVIVTVDIPDQDGVYTTYQFQTFVPRYEDISWKSDFVNGRGKITEYTKEIINKMANGAYFGSRLDHALVSFIHLEDIPIISYLK